MEHTNRKQGEFSASFSTQLSIGTNDTLKTAKLKVKQSNYGNDEIMEYFSKQVATQCSFNEKEVAITDSFGFVEQTIELNQASNSNEIEQSNSKDEEYEEKGDRSSRKTISSKDAPISQKIAFKQLKQENARLYKWKEMLEDYPEKLHVKLKLRCRKGIPDSFRGYAWQILIQGQKHLNKEKSQYFKSLLEQGGERKTIVSIFKDVSRTFPQHVFFKDKFGVGQKALFCVLKALSISEPETGYVQGMGYMAAVLLTYMDMEDAFCCMIGLLKGFQVREMYLPKMPGLQRAFYIHLNLMKKYLPKLNQHLINAKYEPTMYGSQWFMTIFAVGFPFELTVRIWDIFMVEGRKILFRVALAIFKLNQQSLLGCELEGIFDVLRNFQKSIDADSLIKTALSFKFSKKLIDKFEKEFYEKPDKELQKLCEMY
ncbi:tbc protein [Stylonychia lemnae]|uniref:Tbc protein n=1 Tax=Stylonychia lemnae TaxID=5949 RepID=A0A077ZME4_STYLE|nr:tbc protein [Stylonychia lemnae]|eukprot:CDW71133.1 tbc protein [Stylonychia lemnae]